MLSGERNSRLEGAGLDNAERAQANRVSKVRIDGIMMSSGGDNVVWINAESFPNGTSVEGATWYLKTADSATYQAQVMRDGKLLHIEPGQCWSEGTDSIKNNDCDAENE